MRDSHQLWTGATRHRRRRCILKSSFEELLGEVDDNSGILGLGEVIAGFDESRESDLDFDDEDCCGTGNPDSNSDLVRN